MEEKLAPYRALAAQEPPRGGWVRAVRESLGMTLSQFSRRLSLASPSNARQIERAELEGSISLKRLRAAADALGCDLVVALVPRKPLEETALEQARRRSADRLRRVTRTMDMEGQGVAPADYEAMLEQGAFDLLGKEVADLWD